MKTVLMTRDKIYRIREIIFLIFIQFIFCAGLLAQDKTEKVENMVGGTEDSTLTRKLSFNGYPYAFYTPETQFAVGAGGILIFYTSQDRVMLPSKVTLGAYYTTNKQYKITLNPIMYFMKNDLYISLPTSFGHFVDKFWGVGNNTPETGNEQYTMDVYAITLEVQFPTIWFACDRTGIIFDYDNTEIVDKQNNTHLIEDLATGSDGGQIFGIGTDLVWDTRDNLFFPNSGGYQYFKFVAYPSKISDFVFYSLELDVRHYLAFSPDHVLAGEIYFAAVSGETPFYKLPALGGGERMRGYFEGRYRDNFYSTFQFEYRQYFWWKFGFVVFAGMGDVAEDMTKFNLKDLKYSYGAGLRFLFNEEQKVNLRMDIGIGQDGNSGLYFGIEEAF
jgi:outer membrane protein assembly factor BamA